MSPDEIRILLSYIGSFGFGGILAGGIVFFLLKSFLPSYVKEKSKNLATREDIAKITNEIEGVKLQYAVLLQRQSRIHERQVEILSKLYRYLLEVQEYLKLMTKSVVFENENPNEYPKLFNSALRNAYNQFTMGRLLLPSEVAKRVDAFFRKILDAQLKLGMAQHPMTPNGQVRAELWEKAGTIAYQEMPALLQLIEEQARSIIHGQPDV